jgi:hypothetical protein
MCVARGIEVTLIPGHGSELSTGNPTGLWLPGGRTASVRCGHHRRRQAARDAGLPYGWQHVWRVGAMRCGAPFHPPAQRPSEHVQAHMDDGALQHTGIEAGFQPLCADPASPNRPQP